MRRTTRGYQGQPRARAHPERQDRDVPSFSRRCRRAARWSVHEDGFRRLTGQRAAATTGHQQGERPLASMRPRCHDEHRLEGDQSPRDHDLLESEMNFLRMDRHQRMRLRTAALRAAQVYPGPVGELLCRELLDWEEFGYRFGGGALVTRLTDHLLSAPLAPSKAA
jgi:hypothetical protein